MAAFTLLVAALLVGAAQASYQYVFLSPSGVDRVGCGYTAGSACNTLNTALQQVQSGGTINVMPGVYNGTANFVTFNMDVNLVAYRADLGPAIFDGQMRQQHYLGPLIINGSASVDNHGITVNFRGLTFQNWGADQAYGIVSVISDENSPFPPNVGIFQCVFKNTDFGVYANDGDIQMDSTVIIGFPIANSYGIFVDGVRGGPLRQASLLVTNVTISSCDNGIYASHAYLKAVINQALFSDIYMCGIHFESYASASIDGCQIDQSNGGFYFERQSVSPGPVTISNTTFSNLGWGFSSVSGLTVLGNNEVHVKSSTFFNISSPGGTGAGIHCDSGSMTVQSSSFINNLADDGAAAWCDGCDFHAANNYIHNNVEKRNTGPCNGFPSAATKDASAEQ